jgi:polyisoprenoid-binding protein YceI
MATETEAVSATEIPTGVWNVDPIHSVATFSVRHMMVGTFHGEFSVLEGSLADGKLSGDVKVSSLKVKEEKLLGHLLTPDFFDAERFPEVSFESSSLNLADGVLTIDGTLTIKETALPVTATGDLVGPVVTMGDVEKIGINLETTIDRNAVGLTWNAPLPQGGVALGSTVTISVSLELARADD